MNAKNKPFVTLQNQKDEDVFWIPKPTNNNVLNCVAAFDAMRYLVFVDALNNLAYAEVKNISSIDESMSLVTIKLIEDNSLTKIIEDIPQFLFQYVEQAIPSNKIHKGKGVTSGDH